MSQHQKKFRITLHSLIQQVEENESGVHFVFAQKKVKDKWEKLEICGKHIKQLCHECVFKVMQVINYCSSFFCFIFEVLLQSSILKLPTALLHNKLLQIRNKLQMVPFGKWCKKKQWQSEG